MFSKKIKKSARISNLLKNIKTRIIPKRYDFSNYRVISQEEIMKLESNNPVKIFFPCFPKTASTYIAKTLATRLEYKYVVYNYGAGRNEQDLYPPLLEKYKKVSTVTHQHLRATEPNLNLLAQYNINPVILTRNIYDCIVSLRDHILNENEKWPMAYITDEFKKLPITRQYDFIIEFFIPWYINFYVSWKDAEKKAKIPLFWTSYEEFKKNEVDFFKTILEYFNIDQSLLKNIKLPTKETRFNIGKTGRGRVELNSRQIKKIQHYTTFYTWCDFTPIEI